MHLWLFCFSSSYAVAAALQTKCTVQMSPFSKAGCALDSRYGLQCIQFLLSTTNLSPTRYDVIIFNFGMHDINFSDKFPEVIFKPSLHLLFWSILQNNNNKVLIMRRVGGGVGGYSPMISPANVSKFLDLPFLEKWDSNFDIS